MKDFLGYIDLLISMLWFYYFGRWAIEVQIVENQN